MRVVKLRNCSQPWLSCSVCNTENKNASRTVKIIRKTDEIEVRAVAIRGTGTEWVYNYWVHRLFVIFGFIRFWKAIDGHEFSFPRYSNNPKRDGLKDAMEIQSRYYPYVGASLNHQYGRAKSTSHR